MKNFVILFLIFCFAAPAYAASINAAAYKTMQQQAYQNRYRTYRQTNQQTPYWQRQADFRTRQRIYTNYSDATKNYYSSRYRGGNN